MHNKVIPEALQVCIWSASQMLLQSLQLRKTQDTLQQNTPGAQAYLNTSAESSSVALICIIDENQGLRASRVMEVSGLLVRINSVF